MTDTPLRRCGNCIHFSDDSNDGGTCRFNPPQYGGWPIVIGGEDWCSKFTSQSAVDTFKALLSDGIIERVTLNPDGIEAVRVGQVRRWKDGGTNNPFTIVRIEECDAEYKYASDVNGSVPYTRSIAEIYSESVVIG